MENEENKMLEKLKQFQNKSNSILNNIINIVEKTKEEIIFKEFEEKINTIKFSRIDKNIFTLFFDEIKEELNNNNLNNINLNFLTNIIEKKLKEENLLTNEKLSFKTVYQPIIDETGKVKKLEALSDFSIENKNENENYGKILGKYKENLLYFLSDYANGSFIYDDNGNLKTDVVYNEAKIIEKNSEIDNDIMEKIKKQLSNELFIQNINDSSKNYEKLKNLDYENGDFKFLKGQGETVGISNNFTISINAGKNELFNTELFKNLNKEQKHFLKEKGMIEILEHPIELLDNKILNKDNINEEIKEFKETLEEVKKIGTRINLDDGISTKKMYVRINNLETLFEDKFSTIKIDQEIMKKVNLYLLLKKINEEENSEFKNELIYSFLNNNESIFILKKCGFNLTGNNNNEKMKELNERLDEINKYTQKGMVDFVKINFFNIYNIKKDTEEEFYNFNTEEKDYLKILYQLKNKFSDNTLIKENSKEITCEYIELKETVEFIKNLSKEIKKETNKEIKNTFQGYYYFKNLDENIILKNQKNRDERSVKDKTKTSIEDI